ncbi:DUF317 domain-containing protein [Streptomyces sp. NPDC052101]|uniref:DUF317 domain-containing protein n=1 Tax=Streptomyces sp. NPDC052101 TaxID=3155763 RepID=UPI003421047C
MPVSERQLAAFADEHAMTIPFDTQPRYIAGPGDPRHVTHALATVGWANHADPLSAQVELISPDRRTTLRISPQDSGAWWRIDGNPADGPYWYAHFGQMIPVEILAGLTDALTGPVPHEIPDVWAVFSAAGWTCTRQDDGTHLAVSPDQLVHVSRETRHSGEDRPFWRIEAFGASWERLPFWTAWLANSPPAHVMSGFASALVSADPLQRGMHARTGYSVTQERSPLTPEQVIETHTRRLEAARARARSARQAQKPAPHTRPAAVPDRPQTAVGRGR